MRPLARIRKRSVADQVADRLKEEILSGRLRADDHLPPERELALRFGTNRTTLREALRELEALGLVRIRQGDGVAVLDFRRSGELNLLPAYLAGVARSEDRLRALDDALRIRAVVLSEGAALAAERAGPEARARIAQAHEAVAAAVEGGDAAAGMRADLAYYRTLLEASGSVVILWAFNTFVRTFEELLERMPGMWMTPPGYLESLGRLTRAVVGRRPGAARRAAVAHFSRGDHLLLGTLDRSRKGRKWQSR
jgi:DNA-binding FadR family transcriptional regulator